MRLADNLNARAGGLFARLVSATHKIVDLALAHIRSHSPFDDDIVYPVIIFVCSNMNKIAACTFKYRCLHRFSKLSWHSGSSQEPFRTCEVSASLRPTKAFPVPCSQATSRNILLSDLTAEDYTAIRPYLARLALPLRFRLQDAGKAIKWAYFPEDGVASIVANDANGRQVEVGIFGSEGMSATAAVLGTDLATHDVYMQIEGVSGLRIAAVELRRAMADSPSLRGILLRYVQTAMVQSSSSTAAAAGYTIDQRLARWLLMCHDRVDGDDVKLTHEFMSAMLGIRRAGVTVALQVLEDRQLIAPKRGVVTILDRNGLERVAGSSYGFAEDEYGRLMGAPLRNAKSKNDTANPSSAIN